MDENQEQFISWIAAKLEATDEEDLQAKLEGLGEDGIKQAYDQFLTEGVASKKDGGKLEYIKCLQEYKRGGKVSCGCGGKKLALVKADGGNLGMKGPGNAFKGTKAVKGLNPHKIKMGQGADGVMGSKPTLKRQAGGTLTAKQPTQAPSTKSGGNNQMQTPSPEQIQDQKVDEKANSLLNKKKGVGDSLTPMQTLLAQMKPKQIKAPKEKTIKLVSKNDIIYGVEK